MQRLRRSSRSCRSLPNRSRPRQPGDCRRDIKRTHVSSSREQQRGYCTERERERGLWWVASSLCPKQPTRVLSLSLSLSLSTQADPRQRRGGVLFFFFLLPRFPSVSVIARPTMPRSQPAFEKYAMTSYSYRYSAPSAERCGAITLF